MENEEKSENRLTSGSIAGSVLRFSLPYLLAYFLQTLHGMADLFIIGQFGAVADTTAVSIGSQVMHMLTVMLVGLAMGTTVYVGQAVGGGDHRRAAKGIGNTVTLFMLLSVVLTGLLLGCRSTIAALMSTPSEALDGTLAYLTVCFAGIPFITAYNIISAIYRGLGDSKSPMYFVAAACVANIGLDYLFMGAFSMGPIGAALGTTLSQALSVLLALLAIRRHHALALQKGDFRLHGEVVGQLLRIGAPVCMQDGLIQIAFIIITVIANRRGLVDSAAVGIVEKIISFVFLVPSSMLSTVSALGAQNIGAGRKDRALGVLRFAICIALGFGLAVAAAVQFAAEPFVQLFTPDAAVIRAGGQYLRGYIWDCVFAGIHFSFSGYFCAVGRSELSFLHNILAIVLMRVPGVYLASRFFPDTLLPMGLATAAGSLVSVIICVIAFVMLRRQDRRKEADAL